ncbi:MAG: aminopeptidase N [Gammaproteobacteria bacterium]|nr:MAG: aminopeptidase N [Gammaproteobacteria bacterium]
MRNDIPKTIYLKDYAEPDYWIESIDLHFNLGDEHTIVKSRLSCKANNNSGQPIVLSGEELELLSLRLEGKVLTRDQYQLSDELLTVPDVPTSFILEIETRIHPRQNTSLEGLYVSSGMFCTQCEAEGFRKITYYLDRPDVMAKFSTTIVADKDKFPVLLSNGNLVDRGEFDDGNHWVRWEDPFKKPAYLFALVAGKLDCLEDTWVTRSKREVDLQIYVEPGNLDKTRHAMASLKKAMQWDEETFGLEYDLDIYMIVAVGDFNMGAMENKGLNIFNTAYVLAKPETATDSDYEGIESVIAHEYFHNWTGNRITCRDWFQLSLKEGLTVFRDQEFSADMTSRAVKRISDVRMLRARQFSEDAGPMAHPVRPDSYVEINNFYTVTVYEKGAEVVRMYHTLLGNEGFRKGMDLYFKRHDGDAVTTDDFCRAMADANDVDLTQFKRWYSQAGTPGLEVKESYNPDAESFQLNIKQSCPPTPGHDKKAPFHIPLAMGLLDDSGNELPLQLEGESTATKHISGTRVLNITEQEQSFTFINIKSAPTPSLLRGFSAPVKLVNDFTDERLAFLMAHDTDSFNRWDAGQQLATRIIKRLVNNYQAQKPLALDPQFVIAIEKTLNNKKLDKALISQTLVMPSEIYLAELSGLADPVAIHEAREFVRRTLATELRASFLSLYQNNQAEEDYRYTVEAVGRRSLKNQSLGYLMMLDDPVIVDLCMHQYQRANNMTDSLAALSLFSNKDLEQRPEVLHSFYKKWQHEPLVVNKWFSAQATSQLPGTLDEVKSLMKHPAFDIRNPNKVRALIGAFAHGNPLHFHDSSGSGYEFLADRVLELDPLNPQVASRMVSVFNRWRKYDPSRQQQMRTRLELILGTDGLSKDVQEIVSKSLADK